MSILINGMEMPDNCALCPMWDAGNCLAAAEAIICEYNKRPSDCPLANVPPHRRLIDADEFFKDICNSLNEMTAIGIAVDGEWMWDKLNDALDNAPTIIPAEDGKT